MKNLNMVIIAVVVIIAIIAMLNANPTAQAVCPPNHMAQFQISEAGIAYYSCTQSNRVKDGPSGKVYKQSFGFKMTGDARFRG